MACGAAVSFSEAAKREIHSYAEGRLKENRTDRRQPFRTVHQPKEARAL
jgi:hypothetical protein